MRLVDIKNLTVNFPEHEGIVQAVRGVTMHVDAGESLGIVGESGSGKSVTCMAILRLLREPPAKITADHLILGGEDMLTADRRKLASMRGRIAAMVFQDPMTAFDPVFSIGHQIIETIQAHRTLSHTQAKAEAAILLAKVEIKNPAAVLESYPHQLSGGMLQRAMIAMALSCRPRILFADEPTTALDVTIQAQVLALIDRLRRDHDTAVLLITHDLGVVGQVCDRVGVMHGGKLLETGQTRAIFANPQHPYTRALMDANPVGKRRGTRLPVIPPEWSVESLLAREEAADG